VSVLYSTITDGIGCKILNLGDVRALVKDKNYTKVTFSVNEWFANNIPQYLHLWTVP